MLATLPVAGQEPTAPEPTPGAREVCSYRLSMERALECGPEAEVAVAPPKRGQRVYEVTRFGEREPTAEQRAAADDLLKRSRASVEEHGWLDFEKAKADGYTLLKGDHAQYVKREYIDDDRVLDPDHPEYLMFYEGKSGQTLVAVMFVAPGIDAEGPQIGGNLTKWHYHLWSEPMCLLEGGRMMLGPPEDGVCPEGELSHRSPEMLHVWFIDHPDGPFASQMHLPPDIRKNIGQHHH
jgi:hypothetical protein